MGIKGLTAAIALSTFFVSACAEQPGKKKDDKKGDEGKDGKDKGDKKGGDKKGKKEGAGQKDGAENKE